MLPPIDSRSLPADVRAAAPEDQRLYVTALQFERTFVEQLARQLTATAESDGEEDAGGAGTSFSRSLLPGALADGITASGGLGLARDLWRGMLQARGPQA